MSRPSNGTSAELRAGALSTLDLLIAGMSYMAPGFSLFFTTAVIAGQVGIYIPLTYLLAGAGVLCTGAALAEFSRLAPSAGSLQTFIARGFGRVPSVTGGLVLMAGYWCLQSAVAALWGGWSSHLLSNIGVTIPWQILTVLGVALATWLMVRGVQVSIRATWILFLVEFVIVLAIGIAVLLAGGADGLSAEPLNPSLSGLSLEGLALGMVFATFSFVGFEGSVSFAEETPNPRKALPIAVIGGVAVIVALYVFVAYAAVIGFGTDGAGRLADDSEPIATLARLYAGPLRPLLEIAVLTSIAANLMAAGNSNARILFNLGRERAVHPALGRVHPEHQTPHVAIVAFMAATVVPGLIASIWWDYLTAFGNIAGLGALLALLIYMIATVSLIAYVRRSDGAFRTIPHLAVPLLGAAIWLVPLWGSIKPGQAYPYNLYPYITLGLIVAFTAYALARRGRTMPPGVSADATRLASVTAADSTTVTDATTVGAPGVGEK